MIRSNFFTNNFLNIFTLTHNQEEEVWPDGTYPMLFNESNCVCLQSFRSVTPFFLEKVLFLAFLKIRKGMWPYIHAYDVPLMTPILTEYGFVGLTSTIQT